MLNGLKAVGIATMLALFGGDALGQILERSCLEETDQGDGLALFVDGIGDLHLTRGVRLTGALLYTRVDVEGEATSDEIVNRVSRLPFTQTLATGITLVGDTVLICFQDKLGRRTRVASGQPGDWTISTVEDDVRGDGCAIVHHEDTIHVIYENRGVLRHARGNGNGSWSRLTADRGGGNDVGALAKATMTDTDVLVVAHRDETNQSLRVARWNGVQWSVQVPASPLSQPGLRPAITATSGGNVQIFHGTGAMDSGQSDGTLLQTQGVPGDDLITGPLPDFSAGGFTGAAHGDRGTFVVTRRFSRSALFGDSDGLLLLSGAPFLSTPLEQYGAGDVRHTFKYINVALDPFGLPVVAFVDEFAGRPNRPGGAPVCFWRPKDTDRDRIPDEIEAELGTNPEEADSDNDGRSDGEEVLIDGTNPLAGDICRPTDEVCDGGDNDCDGRTDEQLIRSCYDGPNNTQGVGRCQSGTQACDVGQWGDCANDVLPAAETCNDQDDDCDGRTDENAAGVGEVCQTDRVGVCRPGTRRCVGGTLVCLSTTAPTSERCNQADDDCDGFTDEGQQVCGDGVCETTVALCRNGQSNLCVPTLPTGADTLCDGVDDDCDGRVDEAFVPSETTCGIGACRRTGALSCAGGVIVDSCEPGDPDDVDGCNGVDDDCDGRVDESFVGQPTQCGEGACAATAQEQCRNGRIFDPCTPEQAAATDRSCNGIDDDCNGRIDDGVPVTQTNCGQGACATVGTRRCIDGVFVDDCQAGREQNVDLCEGEDNDCDGRVDEGFRPSTVECGLGLCANSGRIECIDGVEVSACEPRQATGADSTCDGLDDDCDERVDEAFVGRETRCGLGECRATGRIRCIDGIESDSCQPANPQDDDADCDGVDSDCDGRIDEAFVGRVVVCGEGACEATARERCEAGVRVDLCRPSQGAVDDTTCDGLDDDCDGNIDENFDDVPSQCGVGTCRSEGQLTCVEGTEVDTCRPGQPAPLDSACNGRDDDCDGRVDEDFDPQPTQCGRGVCQSVGTRVCIDGNVRDNCEVSPTQGDDTECDGLDTDCDGQIDEAFVPTPLVCGVGACQIQGVTACENGRLLERCNAGDGQGDDADCDGVDDDCDGRIDEGFIGAVVACGVGACANESQAVCRNGQVVDTCVPRDGGVGSDECDGSDSDCDGLVDEDHVLRQTTCGVGACEQSGVIECQNGREQPNCQPLPAGPLDNVCDGIDSDCDDRTDEAFESRVIECGQGICRRDGVLVCRNGRERRFCRSGQPTGDDRNCDGLDDDCDGAIDEGFQAQETVCGVGACSATGQLTCVAGRVVNRCQPGQPVVGEDGCDGRDNDCDGRVDEDFEVRRTQCGTGVCGRSGVLRCIDGVQVDGCQPGAPTDQNDDDCDGVDADCDGQVDEGFTTVPTTCGLGICAANGLLRCVGGQVVDSCRPAAIESATDRCDGRDEDCDGLTDENHQRVSTRCGDGVCASSGRLECEAGAVVNTCTVGQPAGADDDCDNQDEDCDGTADEAFVGQQTQCGVGACLRTGVQTCRLGRISDTCRAGTPDADDASCDGIDQDCDDLFDEDFVGSPTQCGRGVCRQVGRLTCIDGQEADDCQPGAPQAEDTACDALDTDCDGRIDEDFVSEETFCGTGICAARGVTRCVGGQTIDSCQPGPSDGDDSVCNGLDDDCDFKVDEGIVPVRNSCGVGVCRASGLTLCLDGQLTNTCEPGQPTGRDADCDGIDQDCDGRVDEAYRQQVVRCGIGVCEASGVTRCRNGQISELCVPRQPAGDDVTCDRTDDDCDGQIDEAVPERASSCGEGTCQRDGVVACIDGEFQDRCEPGEPRDNDRGCDGVDSDCDGQTDEGYTGSILRCGRGECRVEQRTQCVDGVVDRGCTPDRPAENDDNCDGLDDDCDGRIDEDVVVRMIRCGAGACAVDGLEICFMAQWFDRCTPLDPAPDDQTCDGQDDDCDDLVDEDCREDGGISSMDMGVDTPDALIAADAGLLPPEMGIGDAIAPSGGADGDSDARVLGDSETTDAGVMDADVIPDAERMLADDGPLGGRVNGESEIFDGEMGGGREADAELGRASLDAGLAPVLGGVPDLVGGSRNVESDSAVVDLPDADVEATPDAGTPTGGESQGETAGGPPMSSGRPADKGGTNAAIGGCPDGVDCGNFGGVESGRPVKEACDCSVESRSPTTIFWMTLIVIWPYLRRRRLL
ncbi:MAG: MopE-related protein [Myxococcota bacterium]|nr:MopE-related protein [Myxococcota bacterium]